MRPIWVGDIGGTNARIEVVERRDGAFSTICADRLPSGEYKSLGELLTDFRVRHPEAKQARKAGFAIAANILGDSCQAINLPWRIDRIELENRLELESVKLINDLEGAARGLPLLDASSLHCLQDGDLTSGPKALAFAGTGLGQAASIPVAESWHALASEGGHSSFSPRNELEIDLWRFVAMETGHVSWERLLSGPGLVRIYRFLLQRSPGHGPSWFEGTLALDELPRAICQAGLTGDCAIARSALELFTSLYGCEAANLALKMRADGGVFLGGGMAAALLPILKQGHFLTAFLDKGRYRDYLQRVRVSVVLDERIAVLGVAEAVWQAHSR